MTGEHKERNKPLTCLPRALQAECLAYTDWGREHTQNAMLFRLAIAVGAYVALALGARP